MWLCSGPPHTSRAVTGRRNWTGCVVACRSFPPYRGLESDGTCIMHTTITEGRRNLGRGLDAHDVRAGTAGGDGRLTHLILRGGEPLDCAGSLRGAASHLCKIFEATCQNFDSGFEIQNRRAHVLYVRRPAHLPPKRRIHPAHTLGLCPGPLRQAGAQTVSRHGLDSARDPKSHAQLGNHHKSCFKACTGVQKYF